MLAVAAKAIECNVSGFLHWLVHHVPTIRAEYGQTTQKERETDWISQLNRDSWFSLQRNGRVMAERADFCRQNDMRQPRVSQEICRRGDGDAELAEDEQRVTMFRGKIVLDDEEYLDE